MNPDSPELPAPTQLSDRERIRQSITRSFPLGDSISPVYVVGNSLTLTEGSASHEATPRETLGGLHTPTPPAARPPQHEWVSARRTQTAPHNERSGPLPMQRLRCVSAGELMRGSRLPAMRHAEAPAMAKAAVTLSFDSPCFDEGLGRSPSNCSSDATGASWTQENRISPPKAVAVTRRLSESASSIATESRVSSSLSNSGASLRRHTTMAAAGFYRASTPLPSLPSSTLSKAPTALAPPPAKENVTLSPMKTGDRGGEAERLPRSVSPLEGYSGIRVPHRPQHWSGSDDYDGGPATPSLEMDAAVEEVSSGGTGVLRARRGKRVGRGFNQRRREVVSGELKPQPWVKEASPLPSTLSDVSCNAFSPGLSVSHTLAAERSRRSSISFSNKVAIADEAALKDDGLRQLSDTPHHESIAQPPPQYLIDASFSALSSTTIFGRGGVMHII